LDCKQDADAVTTSGGIPVTSRPSRSSAAASALDETAVLGSAASTNLASTDGRDVRAGTDNRREDAHSVDALGTLMHGEAVQRTGLLRRLNGRPGARVATVIAPAGSGKTTLLAQWSQADTRPVAWVNVVHADRDRTQMAADIARSVARALGSGPTFDLAGRLEASDPTRTITRLARAIVSDGRPGLLLLDDVHRLRTDPLAIDPIVMLVDQLPESWSVGIAARQTLDFPLARWQLAGPLVRIGLDDLVLDAAETSQLLASLGLTPTDELVGDVLSRTEGWPAGVYFAALSLRSDRPLRHGRLVAGDDELIRSYLETEILSGIDPSDRELLTKTSIVREVSGPLADAITGRTDSGERLYRLSKQNLLVRPVDAQERWYRYHGLLADLLQRELEDRGSRSEDLHARAARWYEKNGTTDDALGHALRSGSRDVVRRVILSRFQDEYRAGRAATVLRWLGRVSQSPLAWDPELALVGALTSALEGDASAVARWSAAAGLRTAGADESNSADGLDRSIVRAFLCASGPEQMLADVECSLGSHEVTWAWRSLALMLAGQAHRMLGNDVEASASFEAVDAVPDAPMSLARLPARAERAIAAMGAHSWSEAEQILMRDRRYVLDELGDLLIPGTLWLVADARMSVHRGDLRTAAERLRRAQLGRVNLSSAIPWYAVRALTEMAHVQLLCGDGAGARTSVAQARDILRSRPLLATLVERLEEIELRARRSADGMRGGSTLSPAELRLLPLLQSYLSFKEIGQRLGISSNTVKTEAMSIYGKLGASTRSEAVEQAIAAGLLEDAFGTVQPSPGS
jgi:LuxR family maltose regulon positive regulatory protein